jgi:hypothetical protein
MPKPSHTRLTWKGVFGTSSAPAEEWQFSLSTTYDPTALSTQARTALADALKLTYTTKLAGVLHQGIVMTSAEFRRYAPGGLEPRATDGSFSGQGFSTVSAGVAGGLGGVLYPPQVALVVSLVTPRPGATGKGRFYLPIGGHAITVDSGFILPQQNADILADAVRDFLNTVSTDIGAPLVVVSSMGYTSPVTGMKIGRVLDTHRSRRARMKEAYVNRALTAGPGQ